MPSKYIHKNFKDDIDDSAAEREEDVEARFGRTPLEAEQIGVSYFRFGADFRAPFGHSHEVQEEAYVIVSGSGRMRVDDDIFDVRQWDVIRVAPEAIRAFQSGPDGLELIAVGGNRPPDGDGKMQPDWWTED